MSLTLFLAPGTVPFGTPLPGNAQALINLISQYTGIAGEDGFSGLNYGSDTPSPENRAYPWFKTDTDGNPIGLFSWNGSDWVTIPTVTPNGPTTSRPLSPAVGTKYLDTTINVELMFLGGQWVTAGGSPGDIKFVNTADIATALNLNPGWTEYTAAAGRVIGAAGSGSGLTPRTVGSIAGEENHVLVITELASHTHTTTFPNANADGNDFNADQGLIGHGTPGPAGTTGIQSGSTGGDVGHNTLQPTIFQFCLIKS